jgi:hypothetical protein
VAKRILSHLEIPPERLLLEWVSAAEGVRFAEVVTNFTKEIKRLGPLSSDAGKGTADLEFKLRAAKAAVSGEKLRWVAAKQTEFVSDGNKYGEVFTSHEINRLLDGVIVEEITAQRILLLLQQGPFSVKDLSEKLDLRPPDVLKNVLALQRKEQVRLSGVRGRSPLYIVPDGPT